FAFVSFWPALDKEHSGPAKVIDADTIEIDAERHRFYGIDAVEHDQTCRRRNGETWLCGREATAALVQFLEGRTVTCEVRGRKRDPYGRFTSICYVGGDNIAAWASRSGWAVA